MRPNTLADAVESIQSGLPQDVALAEFVERFDMAHTDQERYASIESEPILTNDKKLAPSSILIAVSAIRFLYIVTLQKEWAFDEVVPTCKKPQKLPTILSPYRQPRRIRL